MLGTMPEIPAASSPPDPDPRPVPPREPELEDCCCTGCVHCVFDLYQVALERYELALKAWEARHPDMATRSRDVC